MPRGAAMAGPGAAREGAIPSYKSSLRFSPHWRPQTDSISQPLGLRSGKGGEGAATIPHASGSGASVCRPPA